MHDSSINDRLSSARSASNGGGQERVARSRMDSPAVRPVRDPLAALEAARRIAHEEELAERWDGLS